MLMSYTQYEHNEDLATESHLIEVDSNDGQVYVGADVTECIIHIGGAEVKLTLNAGQEQGPDKLKVEVASHADNYAGERYSFNEFSL